MKLLSTLLIILLGYQSYAQIVVIPDANFKNALVNTLCVDTDGDGTVDDDVDTNNDGEIQQSEANVVQLLNIYDRNISSLEGIQHFINLESLTCDYNNLTELDFSQNLLLKTLSCRFNSLTQLNLSQNQLLEFVGCAQNQLTSLDFSLNPNLGGLDCEFNNLTFLNVMENVNLTVLACGFNSLNQLDVSNNVLLEWLSCHENNLLEINVTQNSLLRSFWVNGNSISTLDLLQNPLLWRLHVNENELTELDMTNQSNLLWFTCNENQLFTLDLSQNAMLTSLNCRNNNLHNLNIQNGNNENLNLMYANDNPNLFCIQVDDENATQPFCNTEGGWCTDNGVEYSEFCILGVDEVNISRSIILHPNPVKENLSIECQVGLEIQEIKIYNTVGKMICEETVNFNEINVSHFENGIYFITIKINDLTFFRRIIKL